MQSLLVAPEPEHDCAAGHAETAEEDEHDEHGQLLNGCVYFLLKRLLQRDRECVQIFSVDFVLREYLQLRCADKRVPFPVVFRTRHRQLFVFDSLFLIFADDVQFKSLAHRVEVPLNFELILLRRVDIDGPRAEVVFGDEARLGWPLDREIDPLVVLEGFHEVAVRQLADCFHV